jgi:O-antigen ligase
MFWNTGITRANTNKLLLLSGIMFSAMLLPSLEIRSSLPRVRLDDALIFGAFAINLLLRITRRTRDYAFDYGSYLGGERRGLREVRKVFLLFLGSIVISNLFAVLFLAGSIGLRDIMEGVTLLKYYLIITLTLSLDLQGSEFEILRNTFLVCLGVILILSWGQFLNIANVNAWLTPFFAQSHLDNLVNANPPRVLGTFDNPNVMGITSVMMMSLFVTWFYFRKNDRIQAVILFIAIALTIKLTFMTISRTALLATAAVLVFLSVWATFKFNWNKGVLLKIFVLLLLTLTLFFTSPRDFVSRMNEATNLEESSSAQGHFIRAGNAFEEIKLSPILGWGTAKDTMTTLVDDEYALVTRRYGVIGLAIYLWLFLRPAKGALRRIRSFNFYGFEPGMREDKTLLAIAFVASTLAIFVYNITAGTFYNLQLMTLVSLFMGIIYRIEGEND